MAYTALEQIRIRLDEYEVEIDSETHETHVVFPSKPKLEIELQNLIDSAKKDIKDYRRYPSDWSAERIDADIDENYEHIVVELSLYDYNMNGAEFEVTHNENGVNRTFVSRESILGKITPFCNIF